MPPKRKAANIPPTKVKRGRKTEEEESDEEGVSWKEGSLEDIVKGIEPRCDEAVSLCKADVDVNMISLLKWLQCEDLQKNLMKHDYTLEDLLHQVVNDQVVLSKLTQRQAARLHLALRKSVNITELLPGRNIFSIDLPLETDICKKIESYMQSTVEDHKSNVGGVFRAYDICKVTLLVNERSAEMYESRRALIFEENDGEDQERFLFHGGTEYENILTEGFDERLASSSGMFGSGIYFSDISSKSNQYILGPEGCVKHQDTSCFKCTRQLLLCRVCLGKSLCLKIGCSYSHAPPDHHSVTGTPSSNGLWFPEYTVYRGEQALPQFLIEYRLVK